MRILSAAMVLATMFGMAACTTAPPTEEKKEMLADNVEVTLDVMKADDPSFGRFVENAYAYVIFPTVGKVGLGVGGAYGRGQVYEQGRLIGYADITLATVGLQAGAQAFSEVIVFENKAALDQFVNQKFEPAAQASAVMLKSGAATNAKYTDGVAIFAYVKGGAMAEASVGGQRFNFTPLR